MAETIPRSTPGHAQAGQTVGSYHLVSPDAVASEPARLVHARDAEQALRARLLPWLKATIPWPPLEDGRVIDRAQRGPETVLAVTRDGERWLAIEADGAMGDAPTSGALWGCFDADERERIYELWARLGR